MNHDLDDRILRLGAAAEGLQNASVSDPNTLQTSLRSARRIINEVDSAISPLPRDVQEKIRLLNILQRLAYHDPDAGGEVDIARWCEREYATLLQDHPDNVDILTALGHAWLLKSQKTLARIYRDEGSLSSGTSNSSTSSIRPRPPTDDAQDMARTSTVDYVEARDTLRPSLDFLDRAVECADAQGILSGKLLALSAEAYLSFGSVSHPRSNEIYYRTAFQRLLRASQIDGYTLEPHLQHFLDENRPYMDEPPNLDGGG